MRRAHLVLVLFACSSRQTEQATELTETPSPVSVAPDDDAATHIDTASTAAVAENPIKFGAPIAEVPAKHVFKPRRLSSGRHGVSIMQVEIASDGAGVVSIDSERHVRLWPALDGSREPLALPLISPAKIAVHHDAGGFAIASLDTGGGLAILDIDNTDMLVNQIALDAEPAYADVLATGSGFLALRQDHQLDSIDRHGARGATLLPPHGERIAGLFAAAGRVLALVETTKGLHGRWIEANAGTLAWGEPTAALDIDPERTFLSPDAKRIVAMRTRHRGPAVFDLASGAVRVLKRGDSKALEEMDMLHSRDLDVIPSGKLLGWATSDRIVFSDLFAGIGGPFAWYDLRGERREQLPDDRAFMFASEDTVFGGSKAVSFMDRELVIVKPAKLEYIGYRARTARGLHATPAGMVATVGGATLLDDRLRAGKRAEAETLNVDDTLTLVSINAQPTVEDEWLESARPRRKAFTRVALYDGATRKELQTWPVASRARPVRYEPATKRMVIDHGKELEVATFDPATRRFGPSTKIAVPRTTDLVLLDPAAAGGDVAITVHGKELRRWRAEDFDAAVAPAPIAVVAAPEAIDRAGHVYVRETPDTVVIAGRGREVRVAELAGWKLRPNADGSRIAAFRASGVMMLDGEGRVLWTIGMPGIANLAWAADGKLIAQARDLVELSTEDGSIVYAQCGWLFGRRAKPSEDFIPNDHTYCDR